MAVQHTSPCSTAIFFCEFAETIVREFRGDKPQRPTFSGTRTTSGSKNVARRRARIQLARMGQASAHRHEKSSFDVEATDELPETVRKLAPRERQVATLVYRHHALTAIELAQHLNWPRSHGALRVMLQRLVAKGILTRRPSGYGKTFLYVPAIATQDTAELAFTRLAEDFYGGSFVAAADAIQALLRRSGTSFGGSAQAA